MEEFLRESGFWMAAIWSVGAGLLIGAAFRSRSFTLAVIGSIYAALSSAMSVGNLVFTSGVTLAALQHDTLLITELWTMLWPIGMAVCVAIMGGAWGLDPEPTTAAT